MAAGRGRCNSGRQNHHVHPGPTGTRRRGHNGSDNGQARRVTRSVRVDALRVRVSQYFAPVFSLAILIAAYVAIAVYVYTTATAIRRPDSRGISRRAGNDGSGRTLNHGLEQQVGTFGHLVGGRGNGGGRHHAVSYYRWGLGTFVTGHLLVDNYFFAGFRHRWHHTGNCNIARRVADVER